MSRLPLHTLESAPEAARPYLSAVTKDSPTILNFQAHMAHAPIVIASYAGIRQALAEQGSFDLKTRAAIMLAASDALGSAYPLAVNKFLAARAGWRPDQIPALSAGHLAEDGKLNALLAVAREAATGRGKVTEAAWNAALDSGWSDTDLAETFAYVGSWPTSPTSSRSPTPKSTRSSADR